MTRASKPPRRDPRAEQARRRARPAPTEAEVTPSARPEATARSRKDPHARRVGSGAKGRKRVLRGAPEIGATGVRATGAGAMAASSAQPAAEDQPVRIDEPAFLVAVVPDLVAGRLSAHDRDLLGAAGALAGDGGGAVLVVLFEGCRDGLGAAGVDRVIRFRGESFEGYAPEARLEALALLATTDKPPGAVSIRHLLFPDSPYGGADLGRRLAARLGERAVTGCWHLDRTEARRRRADGLEDEHRPLTRVLLLAEEAADPFSGPRREARDLAAPPVSAVARVEDLGPVKVDPQEIDLAEAPFIAAAGNGLVNWQDFHALAEALGAAEGGSRVAVDKGFLPRVRQIGASGTRVTARCYLALGISGAPQHLEGITKCDRVIAVNRDAACPMVKRADLAVVGDLDEILPALLALARERRRNV